MKVLLRKIDKPELNPTLVPASLNQASPIRIWIRMPHVDASSDTVLQDLPCFKNSEGPSICGLERSLDLESNRIRDTTILRDEKGIN